MTELDPRLTDEEAQKVIARALELQTQSVGALTVAEVREIASELSIPEAAVDQALAEYRAGALAAAPSPQANAAVTGASSSERRVARRLTISLAAVGGALALLIILGVISRLFP